MPNLWGAGRLRDLGMDALREIGRLNRLLDGLLAVARAEELTAEPVETGVDGLVAERVEMWQPLASERGVNRRNVYRLALELEREQR